MPVQIVGIDGYRLFRRDWQGGGGGRVALCIREHYDCVELDDGGERVECLWVKRQGKG